MVCPALLADPDCVLVGHSLGGVVCAELLAEDEVRAWTAVFVAVGAPLGLDAVTAGMRPGLGQADFAVDQRLRLQGLGKPGAPLPPGGGLRQQVAVANPRSYEHSIEHYVAHPQVATIIAYTLDAGS